MDNIRIISINVRGLANQLKRRSIFNYYRQRADVLCLQETHCIDKYERVWINEWGGKGFFSNGESNSKGVAILVTKNSGISITKCEADSEGRLLKCQLEKNKNRMIIVNIYAPNEDCPRFFENIRSKCSECFDKLVLIGDFNLVRNPQLDRSGTIEACSNNNKALNVLNSMSEEMMLDEVWRSRNPGQSRFSWHKKDRRGRFLASRLDYALVSAGLSQMVEQTMYLPGIQSDHSAFYVGFKLGDQERGPGFWKFNTTFLKDMTFLDSMNAFSQDFMNTKKEMELVSKWELLKFKIGQFCRDFAREKAGVRELVILQLSEEVVKLEDKVAGEEVTEQEKNLLFKTKADLEDQVKEKVKGVIFRSKANWQDLGEKNSKYFFSLEKARYRAKTCSVLVNEKDEEIIDPNRY